MPQYEQYLRNRRQAYRGEQTGDANDLPSSANMPSGNNERAARVRNSLIAQGLSGAELNNQMHQFFLGEENGAYENRDPNEARNNAQNRFTSDTLALLDELALASGTGANTSQGRPLYTERVRRGSETGQQVPLSADQNTPTPSPRSFLSISLTEREHVLRQRGNERGVTVGSFQLN